ncbi:uncharacterized protein LOC117174446 [Belonocnema kinseyi]|uniref:uncharacterized protein LOC117174446 n=1 Tax=Belonocnema kinseyi TaxID=2817044 RepID=UPI00143D31E7|nr:uncharacterized protein LOC117174446 [Belonocnema kinseyi]XP_033219467.1 uncharacterized protein LOC117174446 [Belonocnema kinseyi]XP_033219468.1 uncharacterized protein LOC117174446 [Belonocnema kinseyi]XP_033219469.1 uncharacterized protein LOC117174446 [Belonocnema kinseyi]XP_033219470.1 uncharacterized protein LOC117174446 [Belonocnema kinseyi]XP_033219471.1 uncharacterized protein LOC117174446 [Belonocnema kinseyi]XP_033219472.1 uncharacterized protein LOC117174446 [Belonocnema kinsey
MHRTPYTTRTTMEALLYPEERTPLFSPLSSTSNPQIQCFRAGLSILDQDQHPQPKIRTAVSEKLPQAEERKSAKVKFSPTELRLCRFQESSSKVRESRVQQPPKPGMSTYPSSFFLSHIRVTQD